jgi:hypothetical protein
MTLKNHLSIIVFVFPGKSILIPRSQQTNGRFECRKTSSIKGKALKLKKVSF